MILLYFLLFLFVEVVISTEVASAIGGVAFFVEIVVSFIIGAVILANFRNVIVEQINGFAFGKISQEELLSKGVLTLIGAFFIIIPGVVTDLLGLLMQFPWFAALAARMLFRGRPTYHSGPNQQKREEDDYIDVEIVDDETPRRGDSTIER